MIDSPAKRHPGGNVALPRWIEHFGQFPHPGAVLGFRREWLSSKHTATMKIRLTRFALSLWLAAAWIPALTAGEAPIPLPEHPRPDFHRAAWLNLNGPWQFRLDPDNAGAGEKWSAGQTAFSDTIIVPFPWGSPLSKVPDKAAIAWYARGLRVPADWSGQRVFLVIGACDWETQAWLDGQPLGTHRGGYTPFEFELTSLLKPGQEHKLVFAGG